MKEILTLENIQVDCRDLSEEQINKMKEVVVKNGYTLWDYKTAFELCNAAYYFVKNNGDTDFLLSINSTDRYTITYEKFMELFGRKEENFKKLVEVLNEELTEKAYNPQYEVTMIAEQPKEELKTFSIREYSTGDFMDLGKDVGVIKAKNKDHAWYLYKETHRLKDNEKGFYSFTEVIEQPTHPSIAILDKAIELSNELKAYKEKSNKLNYELDFNFITQLAERMAQNKHKYEPYNWQKLDNINELKQALFRHVLEVMKGNYEDDNRLLGHIESIALNCMFINYQLNKHNEK